MTRKLLTSPKTKVCTKCGKRKPLGEYTARHDGKDGKQARCRQCRAAESASWATNNKERKSATDAAWAARNRERRAATKAAWYQTNKEDCDLRCALNRDIRGGF